MNIFVAQSFSNPIFFQINILKNCQLPFETLKSFPQFLKFLIINAINTEQNFSLKKLHIIVYSIQQTVQHIRILL